MPATDKNFKGLAEQAVEKCLSGGETLEDSVVSIAKKNLLNPEEVKRLVEKSNLLMSLRHLRSENKKASFALVDYASVLSRTHPTDNTESDHVESKSTKTASILPRTRTRHTVEAFKVAEMCKHAAASNPYTSRDVFTLRKAIEEAKLEKAACELRVQDRIDWLASEFSRSNAPDFSKFASESVALYGQVAEPVVSGLANYLGVKGNLEKVAGIIDNTTPLLGAMKEVCTGVKNLVKQASQLSTLQKELSWCYKEALKG